MVPSAGLEPALTEVQGF